MVDRNWATAIVTITKVKAGEISRIKSAHVLIYNCLTENLTELTDESLEVQADQNWNSFKYNSSIVYDE